MMEARQIGTPASYTGGLQQILNQATGLLAWLSLKVQYDNAAGLLDINRLCEDILAPVFRLVYGYDGLRNLNVPGKDYPAIDLGDDVSRVAFQVTSDPSSAKITDTLAKFVKFRHYERYDHLIVYVLTGKQTKYSGKGWDETIRGRFAFAKDKDIRDANDLAKELRSMDPARLETMVSLLKTYLGQGWELRTENLVRVHLANSLAREKNRKRYIPEIHVEVAGVKDHARYFCHPTVFLRKVTSEANRVDTVGLNMYLGKVSLQPISIRPMEIAPTQPSMSTLPEVLDTLSKHLSQSMELLRPYADDSQIKQLESQVPRNRRYVFDQMKYRIRSEASWAKWGIEDALDDLLYMSSRLLFIVGRAGQGKTNFVCDLAEHVLLKRGIPAILMSGRDFNNAPPHEMGRYFVGSLFGDTSVSVDRAFGELAALSAKTNTPVVIIIDGINEHRQVREFSHYLEQFVERGLAHQSVKFILTCRSEYFDDRFANFSTSSFAKEIIYVKEFERRMRDAHREELVTRYFRFFHLVPAFVSHHANQVLEQDALLLRMFCEAYGDPQAEADIGLPQIADIYRDKVFREYLDRKLAELREQEQDSMRVRISAGDKYKECLTEICRLMITNQQFSQIPVSSLPPEMLPALSSLLAEDIIVRVDPVSRPGPLETASEVVSFAFDEFRDFLIADYLITKVFPSDAFRTTVEQTVQPGTTVAEGVRTYLFFGAKRAQTRSLEDALQGMPWYPETFRRCIFSLEEEYITVEDLERIRMMFTESLESARIITSQLVWRWQTDLYPKLNIGLLFEILDALDSGVRGKLMFSTLRDTEFDIPGTSWTWQPARFAEALSRAIDNKAFLASPDARNMFRILIYSFPVTGSTGGVSFAFRVFEEFAERDPATALSLLGSYVQYSDPRIAAAAWRMVTRIAYSAAIPESILVQGKLILLRAMNNRLPDSDWLVDEICRCLEVCVRLHGAKLPQALEGIVGSR